jgi:hypothetical protein
MTGIVLSASVRQNLLSLQSTSQLLATTQNDLATGNKVNSALDNPTNYFTAQALNSRASDISSLLDSVGNGVQVLQAANTGITSLKSLLDSAKSIANQALQASSGYTTKSQFSATIAGANANNLLGTSTPATAATVTAGAFSAIDVSSTGTAATAAADIVGSGFSALDLSGANSASFTLNVDGTSKSITLDTAAVTAFTGAGGTISGTNASLTATDVAKIIDYQFDNTDTTGAGPVTVNGGELQIASSTTGAASQVSISGYTSSGAATGLADASNTGTAATPAASEDFTLTVDGTAHAIDISKSAVDTYNAANSGATIDASNLGAADVAKLINSQIGGGSTVASVVGGALTFTSGTTGTSSSIALTAVTTAGGATGSTGVVATTTTTGTAASGGLSGLELTIGATAGGTATDITFGSGAGQISTLNDLNSALAANNLMATIDTHGTLTVTTTNNNASATIGDVGGSATAAGNAFAGAVGAQTGPVADASSQETRAGLVSQFNQILDQIKTTAQDSSFNGVNLLNGDLLQLTFNETGTSTLNIQGNTDDPAGLGLSDLVSGTDFLDNAGTNKIISAINGASNTLDSQASTLGSNLSIVQIRQTFSNSMINVLQTGASNLTLADPNELAADSQALSTRQSIAVSALALANQSQQSVLQLLQG